MVRGQSFICGTDRNAGTGIVSPLNLGPRQVLMEWIHRPLRYLRAKFKNGFTFYFLRLAE